MQKKYVTKRFKESFAKENKSVKKELLAKWDEEVRWSLLQHG
jgi:hypothetical protein